MTWQLAPGNERIRVGVATAGAVLRIAAVVEREETKRGEQPVALRIAEERIQRGGQVLPAGRVFEVVHRSGAVRHDVQVQGKHLRLHDRRCASRVGVDAAIAEARLHEDTAVAAGRRRPGISSGSVGSASVARAACTRTLAKRVGPRFGATTSVESRDRPKGGDPAKPLAPCIAHAVPPDKTFYMV